jgi:hypothetical protein
MINQFLITKTYKKMFDFMMIMLNNLIFKIPTKLKIIKILTVKFNKFKILKNKFKNNKAKRLNKYKTYRKIKLIPLSNK